MWNHADLQSLGSWVLGIGNPKSKILRDFFSIAAYLWEITPLDSPMRFYNAVITKNSREKTFSDLIITFDNGETLGIYHRTATKYPGSVSYHKEELNAAKIVQGMKIYYKGLTRSADDTNDDISTELYKQIEQFTKDMEPASISFQTEPFPPGRSWFLPESPAASSPVFQKPV